MAVEPAPRSPMGRGSTPQLAGAAEALGSRFSACALRSHLASAIRSSSVPVDQLAQAHGRMAHLEPPVVPGATVIGNLITLAGGQGGGGGLTGANQVGGAAGGDGYPAGGDSASIAAVSPYGPAPAPEARARLAVAGPAVAVRATPHRLAARAMGLALAAVVAAVCPTVLE